MEKLYDFLHAFDSNIPLSVFFVMYVYACNPANTMKRTKESGS